jgi:hypothetical protein
MKADESADCAGSYGSCFSTGLCFFFFGGPRNRTIHFKNLGFQLGPDLVIIKKISSIFEGFGM